MWQAKQKQVSGAAQYKIWIKTECNNFQICKLVQKQHIKYWNEDSFNQSKNG